MDPTILTLLAGGVAGELFKRVANSKLIRFGDLIRQTNVNRADAKEALAALKAKNLVHEAPSAIEDFSTFYVTADGLETKRRTGI